MWVSISRLSWTHTLLEESGRFSLVLLHRRQANIAAVCGIESGRERDKCSGLDLYEYGDGFLFLKDALTCTACQPTRTVDLGDHSLIIAEMQAGHVETPRTLARQLLVSDLLST